MNKIVYKNYVTFKIKGVDVNLISENYESGISTVAEINDKYYYLGDEEVKLVTAAAAWEIFSEKELNLEDLEQLLIDNDVVE